MLEKCPKCGDPRGDAGGLMCQANGCLLVDSDQRKDAEIARLKAEVANQRHEIGMLLAEIAALKAEVERLNQQPLPSNLGGYQAFRDMVCAALDIEPTWSNEPALAIARLRAEVGRLREYERLHGVRSNEIGKLRVDLAAHKRALAAGPAALRDIAAHAPGPASRSAEIVEAAQEAALKEKG